MENTLQRYGRSELRYEGSPPDSDNANEGMQIIEGMCFPVKFSGLSFGTVPFLWRKVMVTINGNEENAAGISVSEYLKKAGYSAAQVAVEINGNIISKPKYDNTVLAEGDVMEIVGFVGGGCH